MTLKVLAVILSIISMTVAVSSPPSDAYQVGYAEGRFDLYNESKAMKKFYECFAEKTKESGVDKQKVAEACWHDQIEWTKVLYRAWDGMTDQQKVDHVAQSTQSGGVKWSDVLRGNGDGKVMPPLPVEIK
jgi:hypothetical protein